MRCISIGQPGSLAIRISDDTNWPTKVVKKELCKKLKKIIAWEIIQFRVTQEERCRERGEREREREREREHKEEEDGKRN